MVKSKGDKRETQRVYVCNDICNDIVRMPDFLDVSIKPVKC